MRIARLALNWVFIVSVPVWVIPALVYYALTEQNGLSRGNLTGKTWIF